MSTDVIIVGAGPVGLATALKLVRFGRSVRVFSADIIPTSESRATGVLPRTLDLLEASGATERMITAGPDVLARSRTSGSIDDVHLPNRRHAEPERHRPEAVATARALLSDADPDQAHHVAVHLARCHLGGNAHLFERCSLGGCAEGFDNPSRNFRRLDSSAAPFRKVVIGFATRHSQPHVLPW